jgi:hypothetical protein
MPPDLLPLNSIREVLEWYEANLCRVEVRDPRGYRVRFKSENFIHLIQLKNKYGEEPRNLRLALDEIRGGKIQFVAGRFDPQRTAELSWATAMATNPDHICGNWQVLGRGDETYVKNFGTQDEPRFRVLVCRVIGQTRHIVTIFPRERIVGKELLGKIWP